METAAERRIQDDEIEIDMREVFYLFRSKILVIFVSIIVLATGAGLFCEFVVTPKYSSTTKLYILNTAGSSLASISMSDLQVGASLTSDYMELIKSRPAVEEVIDSLKLDTTYEAMLGRLTIANPPDTRILSMTIQDEDPRIAKEIADKFAEVAIDRLSQVMSIEEPHLVEEGHIAEVSDNQSLPKYVCIGALVGVILSMGLILVRYLMDDSIQSSEDVEKYLGLNTLALIPMGEEEYDGRKKGTWDQRIQWIKRRYGKTQ